MEILCFERKSTIDLRPFYFSGGFQGQYFPLRC